jgi:2-dehydro-3-deoxyphosphogluconate aldolase/(4S)-4-hydroxy-2-oxoglutarate aldolase
MTPTELIYGLGWGFDTFKLFPAQQAGGVNMLKALGGPFPNVVFCPTGGITRATAPDYLDLPNVACIGGSWVAPADKVRDGDWAAIEALARDASTLARIK